MRNDDCEHGSTRQGLATKTLGNHTFEAPATECALCGAVCWDNALSDRYNTWLGALYVKDRSLFTVAVELTEAQWEMVARLIAPFPGISKELAMRAMVVVYTDVVARDTALSHDIEEGFAKLSPLRPEQRRQGQMTMAPSLFQSVTALGSIIDMTPGAVIAGAVGRMLVALDSTSFGALRQAVERILRAG